MTLYKEIKKLEGEFVLSSIIDRLIEKDDAILISKTIIYTVIELENDNGRKFQVILERKDNLYYIKEVIY